ncbi:MAG: recombination mediator RecR [Dehalococcoidia bacterium]|jgi:recombination protein RecR|nr:recombination mediator RecR [Dehalococcoidia bacterium]MDP6493838.1 recombination mediator RecR [Dehalococcoidia bacterium]
MTYDFLPSVAAPLARLIQEFHKLPGIGPKSAQRLAYYLIRMRAEEAQSLAESILAVKEKVTFCNVCQNITENSPCYLCSHEGRDRSRICVVEEPLDVLSLERTQVYKGLYHVLHGVISPASGVGPENLKIRELLERLKGNNVAEVILATNPSLEGESTAMYVHRLLSPLVSHVTRLARGLPVGSDLEYADEVTLSRALEGRQEI